MTEESVTVAILGLGEAGSALARGLCADDGWRGGAPGRSVIAFDPEFGQGARGAAMSSLADELSLPTSATYGASLSDAALAISVVTGEQAVGAAQMAREWLRPGALYADFNSITGPQTRAVAEELLPSRIDFVDVAVMGSFMASGHRTPLLLSGPRAADLQTIATAFGTPARVLSDRIGDASAVKILRSVLMKGIEALSVECLTAARRQGLVDEVLDNVSDVDDLGFAKFISVLTTTHLIHARRRMEEVDKAIQNLEETDLPALMSATTRQALARTVHARLDRGEVVGLNLDQALELLDEKVVGPTP